MPGRLDEANGKALRTKAEVLNFAYLVALLPLFRSFSDVHRVILFGSRARGDDQERSDIDLAVDAPDMDVVMWDKLCLSITDNSRTFTTN